MPPPLTTSLAGRLGLGCSSPVGAEQGQRGAQETWRTPRPRAKASCPIPICRIKLGAWEATWQRWQNVQPPAFVPALSDCVAQTSHGPRVPGADGEKGLGGCLESGGGTGVGSAGGRDLGHWWEAFRGLVLPGLFPVHCSEGTSSPRASSDCTCPPVCLCLWVVSSHSSTFQAFHH